MALRPLGFARVLKDDKTGKLVVDKSTMRRNANDGDDAEGDFEGRRRRNRRRDDEDEEDLGANNNDFEPEDDGEPGDLADDEAGDVGDDEAGEEDVGDDITGDDDAGEDDLGDEVSGRRRRRRRNNRNNRRERRRGRKAVRWGKTALSGESNNPETAGDQITINIRPQHWFKAQDITFTGDASAKIDTIFFGDRPIWNNSVGTPVAVFASTGMLRGILNGQKIRPGLDIIIKGTAGTSGSKTTATLIGYKPLNTTC